MGVIFMIDDVKELQQWIRNLGDGIWCRSHKDVCLPGGDCTDFVNKQKIAELEAKINELEAKAEEDYSQGYRDASEAD
jgi:hypothetical protein